MRQKINLITGRLGEYAEKPREVQELDFWAMYIELLNVRNSVKLDKVEKAVMANVLAGPYGKSHFGGLLARKLRTTLRVDASRLSKLKNSLVLKNFLEDTGIKGDAVPTRNIMKFQKYVKDNLKYSPEFIFTFAFKLIDNDSG